MRRLSFFLSVMVLSVLWQGCRKGERATSQSQPQTPPQLELRNIDSRGLLSLFKENPKPILVNFWATWCKPCVEEFPHLLKLRGEFGAQIDFIFVSFDFEDKKDQSRNFLQQQGVDFPTYFKWEDDQPFLSNMPSDWSGALPYTAIHKNGKLVGQVVGGQSEAEFRRLIQILL